MLGFVRFMVYGPLLGALVGVIVALAEIRDWNADGQPDTYIRGTEGIALAVVLWAMGGAIVGVPFGAIIAVFEYGTGRLVRIGLSVSLVVLTAFVACWIFYADTFVGRMLQSLHIGPPTFTVLVGLVMLLATSSPPPRVCEPKS